MSKDKLWAELQSLADTPPSIISLFDQTNRVENHSVRLDGIYADFSKQAINDKTKQTLINLLTACNFDQARQDLFDGKPINTTENRAVLHPTLRGTGDLPQLSHVKIMRHRMRQFSDDIRAKGNIKSIIHIGIGGSDLGPRLINEALYAHALHLDQVPDIDLRFVENIDGASFNDAVRGCDPKSTLVISVSKSFTTQETRMNTEAAKIWLGSHAANNIITVTANRAGAEEFGVNPDNIFDFWDWVGGRYSLWSAVSLSVQIRYGADTFDALLDGAKAMDAHFMSAPLGQNIPVLLALSGVWNTNFLGHTSQAVIPYARRLRLFSNFLQQLEMESNGKGVTKDGQAAGITCPVIWGDEGTNSQHAFFQHLHQSTTVTPVDIIAVMNSPEGHEAQHAALLANAIAQSEALMVGKTAAQVRTELQAKNMDEADIKALIPHKTFTGDRPTTTIALDRLDAYSLGQLICAYEHKVFTQAVIWDINGFDQWGVELGKVLASTVLSELEDTSPPNADAHDASTMALIKLARAAQTG